MSDLRIIENYDSLWKAEFARNILKAHSISCVIQTTAVGYSGYPLGGSMDLLVTVEDAERAKNILESYISN